MYFSKTISHYNQSKKCPTKLKPTLIIKYHDTNYVYFTIYQTSKY